MCQLHCVKEITIGRKTGGVMKIGVRPLPVRQQQQQWRTLALLGSQLSSSRPSTVKSCGHDRQTRPHRHSFVPILVRSGVSWDATSLPTPGQKAQSRRTTHQPCN